MSSNTRQEQDTRRKMKSWVPPIGVAAALAVLLGLLPSARQPFTQTVLEYTLEMVAILPAVMILMGVMTVFVSNDFIGRVLGHSSGIRGMAIAFILGTLPTGPLYVAFPFARTLRDKGAGTANIVIFLSAWACIKLPQELVELRFLGWQFMLTRLALTVVFVVIMSLVIGAAERSSRSNHPVQPGS